MKKQSFQNKFKKFFSNRRNVIWVIVVVSLLILALIKILIWQIYTQDKPVLIPEDVRGEVRKGVEDTVNATVSKVAPDLGQSIIDKSFDNKDSRESAEEATGSFEMFDVSLIGAVVEIPDNWESWDSSADSYSFSSKDDASFLKEAKSMSTETGLPYWGGKSIVITDVSSSKVATAQDYIQSIFVVPGITVEKQNISGREVYYVVDKGPDRYGGGIGYYYIISLKGRVYEIALDYFGDQRVLTKQQNILKRMVETIN